IWFNQRQKPVVYIAEEKDTVAFPILRLQNGIDSSINQGLKYNPLSYSRHGDTAYFFKNSCKTLRYLLVVPVLGYDRYNSSNSSPNYTLQANVGFTPDPLAAGKGDFCSNAIEIDLIDNDNSSNSTSISCHSIGESFGEDGSNMSCLGEIDDVKTTWFKVNYTGNLKNDLSFNLTEKTNYPPNQFKYRVLYGNCNSMTAGPCVDEINSSYRLDCMAPSTYYIQVSSPKNAIGTIELSAKSRPTQYQVCKPFDPDELLAHFIPIGGCNPNDTFLFENLSTQGDSITYLWEFGDGASSTLKSPAHLYNTTGSKTDTFFVTLTVKNTQTLASKSVKKAVYIFKNLIFDLGPDTNNFCNRLFKPDPVLNFTPSLIQWHSDYPIDSPLILSPNLRASSNGIKYYIIVGFSNCRIKDSIKIDYNYHGDREYNYDLCEGGFFQAVVRDTFPIYEWSNGAKTDSFTIDKPGTYTLKLGYTEECYSIYTYNLTSKESPKIKFVGNPQCIGQILEIQPEKDGNYYYYWPHDRSNRQQTVVIDTGYIKVVATLNNCSIIDSYYVDPSKLLFPKFIDTVSCTKPLMLTEKYKNSRYLWNTGDTTNSISINDEGLYQVDISKGDCKISNEWNVTFSEIADVVNDNIILCDTASHIIKIDSNYTVLWFDSLTKNTRILTTEGNYWVEIKDGKCKIRNEFEVKRIDFSQFSLGPDTALCPPFRIELKVPQADTIFWSNGVENEKSNYITDTGYVWVQLLQNGCFASDTMLITTLDCIAKLHVPNAFTPEGENPIFLPKGVNIEEFEMKIYNSWGERLFITNDLSIGWPGTFKGEICQMDVYVYVINYKAQNQGAKTISGGFLLLR
ncbi:MAG: gliding motility-associated C-terminal domain-containing protein, partial [Bacteroidia bacterium]